ncbi:hypothetical protein [Agromyces larvae]|uniref:Glycosyltransferase family 1 protein n=1 Tax=Agromyces larvae TaxID=2929802 RepID=A0ABY4BZ42_9MICO|nr:hypothetical protein [Agromyces larvae]UOE44487.1 hypothetical protein MTO99_01455 [Agromyces larvae]
MTLELAEFIASLGAEVVVATQSFGRPLRSEFEDRGLTVFEITDERLDADLAERMPDVAWIQHGVIPERVLASPGSTTFYFHHMSAHLAPEFTSIPEIESALATAVLFESPSSLDAHVATGLYEKIDPERLQVFGNPAPARFAEAVRPDQLRRSLLVVSNHIPAELLEALELLSDEFDVDLVGSQRELGAAPRRVDVDDIASVGAVVTIGKTVQYSITAGTPVFVYDHFGGPGWLTSENFEHTAYENFSGRRTRRLSAREIESQIRAGFDAAADEAERLRSTVAQRYSISSRFEQLLEWSRDRQVRLDSIPEGWVRAQQSIQATVGTYIREWIREQGNASYNGELAAAWEAQRQAIAAQLHAVTTSRSYLALLRLGRVKRALLAPFVRMSRRR